MAPARPSAEITALDREAGTAERLHAGRPDLLAAAHASVAAETFPDSQETFLPPVLVPEMQETLERSVAVTAPNDARGGHVSLACMHVSEGDAVQAKVAGNAPGAMNQQKKILSFFSRRP